MRRWFGIGGVVGVVGMFAAACTSASDPYPDVQTFCAAKASAECQVASQCIASPTACGAARQSACMKDATEATMGGHRAYYSPNAPACLALVTAAYAPNPTSGQTAPIPAVAPVGSMSPSLDVIDTTCAAVFPGIIPQGGKCTTSADCASSPDAGTSLVCAPVAPGNPKLECTAPLNVGLGQPCGSFGSVCPLGAYCHGSAPAICKAGGQNGQPCSATEVCGVGAFCSIAGSGSTGTCKTGGGPGAACTSNVNCGSTAPYCDTNVPPTGSSTATGSCVEALFSLGTSSADCKAFGGGV